MTATPVTIIGNHLSPFVRKVLGVCHMKGIAYQVDPIVPFFGSDAFGEMNPTRLIPVLVHSDVTLPDSTVICEYLEDLVPGPSMLPPGAARRGKARWLDEYADTVMAKVMLWKVFGRSVVLPGIFGADRNKDAIAKTMAEEVPPILDVLEKHAPESGFLFGPLSMADLSVASHFANLRWARQTVDMARWPKTARWVAAVEGSEPLAGLTKLGDSITRVPPGKYRDVLGAAGVSLSPTTVATDTPRRGLLTQI
jgi:glutathione S-transferase